MSGDTMPVVTLSQGRAVVSSLTVAEHFGKEHKNVLRAIETIKGDCPGDFNALNFEPVDYTDAKGERRPAFNLTRDAFTLLVMGFTGKKALAWKLRYIEAFNAMEGELRRLGAGKEGRELPEGMGLDPESLAVPPAVSVAHRSLKESMRLKLIGEARQLSGNDWEAFDAMYIRLCNRVTDGRASAAAKCPAAHASALVTAWIAERIEDDPHGVCRSTELYNDFLDWCRLRNERTILHKAFGSALAGRLDRFKRGNVYYKGIRLKDYAGDVPY